MNNISININHTPSLTTSQAVSSFVNEVFALSDKSHEVLKNLLLYANVFDEVSPGQARLAQRCDLTREWVCKLTNRLQSHGFLVKTYRHRHTSTYHLNPMFMHPKVRSLLCKLLPTLHHLPKGLLRSSITNSNISFGKLDFRWLFRQFTPFIKNNKLFINKLTNKLNNVPLTTYVEGKKRREMEKDNNFSTLVTLVVKDLRLSDQEAQKIAAYSDAIVKVAYEQTKKAQPFAPFAYLFKMCSIQADKEARAPKVVPRSADVVPPVYFKKPEVKLPTAVELATEIMKCKAGIEEAKTSTNEFRKNSTFLESHLNQLVDKEYVTTGEAAEFIAVDYINKFRTEVVGARPVVPNLVPDDEFIPYWARRDIPRYKAHIQAVREKALKNGECLKPTNNISLNISGIMANVAQNSPQLKKETPNDIMVVEAAKLLSEIEFDPIFE